LALGVTPNYRLSYVAGPEDPSGKVAVYTIHADPIAPSQNWLNHYFTDQSGRIRYEAGKEAGRESQPIAQ
jgi:hypothetical protein